MGGGLTQLLRFSSVEDLTRVAGVEEAGRDMSGGDVEQVDIDIDPRLFAELFGFRCGGRVRAGGKGICNDAAAKLFKIGRDAGAIWDGRNVGVLLDICGEKKR
jgi:hypothetical protein